MTLQLATPHVVTVRALCVALDRALDRRGARLDLARALGIPQPTVSRATDHRRGDSGALRQVAAAAGYEPHPHMPGHYRRRGPVASARNAEPLEA